MDILIELIVFGIVVAAVVAATRQFDVLATVRRRLGGQTATGARGGSVVKPMREENAVLDWVEGATLNDDKERSQLRADLNAAGFPGPSAPIWFVIIRIGLAIGLPVLFLLSQALSAKPMTGLSLIVFSLILTAVGFIAPRGFIDNRAGSRRSALEIEFPDALDLMVICVEAGLGLESAFIRVGRELHRSHPLIATEFDRCSQEFRAGRSRADALRAMADRTSVVAVRSFVALLVQTESLGTSIAQTLKTYADEMREHRFLRAEEKAMRIPVLLTVPLVACILPVIVVSLLLPPTIDVIRTVVPALRAPHG
jgi:tight adherence protein C